MEVQSLLARTSVLKNLQNVLKFVGKWQNKGFKIKELIKVSINFHENMQEIGIQKNVLIGFVNFLKS